MLLRMVFDVNNHTLKMSQVPFDCEGQMVDGTSLFVALFHGNEAAAEALIAATASAGALDVQVEREGVGRGLREVGGGADARWWLGQRADGAQRDEARVEAGHGSICSAAEGAGTLFFRG